MGFKDTRLDSFYEEFGIRVQKARKLRKMTQNQLGAEVGLARGSITNIERGLQRPLLHQAIDIARILNIEPTQLIFGSHMKQDEQTQPLVLEAAAGILAQWKSPT